MLRILLLLSLGIVVASHALLAEDYEPKKRLSDEESINPFDPQVVQDSAPKRGLTFENGLPKEVPPGGVADEAAAKEVEPPAKSQFHRTPPPPQPTGHFDPITVTIIAVIGSIGAIVTCVRLYGIFSAYSQYKAERAADQSNPAKGR